MIILKILNGSLILLHSTSIRKVLMVPQGWGIVGWNVVILLEVIASIPINKLCFLNLIGTFMSKSLISSTFLPNTFHHPYFIIGMTSSFFVVHPVHDCI